MTAETEFYDDVENIKKLCDFLRSPDGPAVREAVEMDKRVYYLKGKLRLNIEKSYSGYCWPNCECFLIRKFLETRSNLTSINIAAMFRRKTS